MPDTKTSLILSSVIEFSQYNWESLGVPPSRRPFLASSILLCLCLLLFLCAKWVTARKKLPPGPKGIPILGNYLQLGAQPWLKFTEWKKIYGPMVYLNIRGQPMLIINDAKVVADLLDRRANIYSDRPRNIVAGETLTGGYLLPLTRYGDLWRRLRRAAHEALSMTAASRYHPLQQSEAILLADDLIKGPEHWVEHIDRVAASAISSIVFDTPPLKSSSDPSIATINDMNARLTNAVIPGAYLVESFPILNYLPRAISKWKRDAEDWYMSYSKIFESRYTEIQARVLSGEEQRPSLCSTLAETSTRHNMCNCEVAWLTVSMFIGGSHTTASTLEWFLLAITAFPEAQRKAQVELDEVVGRARLPSFSDWDHLPYVRALVKEVLRWRPIAPIGLPHAPIQDDWYAGYFIPKGTICFGNIWALNQDPDIFGSDTAEFNPSRHLDEQGKLKPSPETKDEGHYTFGFGRRICVGRSLANYSLFINMATVLWALSAEPVKDANGKYIQPDINGCVDSGVSARPVPFKCTMTPRFADVESVLLQAKEDALGKAPVHFVKPMVLGS